MTNTPNLGLHTWAAQDPVDVTEINENFTQIDSECTDLAQSISALAAAVGSGGHNCRIAYGSYTGNGLAGSAHPNVLNLDFTPVALFLCTSSGVNPHEFSVCLRGNSKCGIFSYENNITWGSDSVRWYYEDSTKPMWQANYSGYQYQYVVLGYSA